MTSKKKKKPYLPNNWKLYKDAPEDMFFNHEFEEIMDWKVAGWELPASVYCMIRVTKLKTGKVKEYLYQRPSAAKAKIKKLMQSADHEFVVVDHEDIQHLSPKGHTTHE